ncbi:MAG: 2-oxoglutarate dehydrogenase complex dihydrolipoyllysine-residue succinyltransferase [Clostridiales bacterium]|nr:2-oxoglutarate dehydrogenase complex dihydrolipoyllysine-residue succinyltransferase [Clostridiales bacterium]
MAREIKVPAMGESIVEATVGTWHKKEGDPVAVGDVLVELETDKVNVEVTAEEDGVVEKILKGEGSRVQVGEVLAFLAEGAPAAVPLAPEEEAAPSPREAEEKAKAPSPEPQPAAPAARAEAPSPAAAWATPSQRRRAREEGEDRRPQPAAPAPKTTPASDGRPPAATETSALEEVIPMSSRRRTIARRLVEAQHTAAMLTTFNEVDMSAIMELRKKYRESFKERHGVSLGFMSFFTKAVIHGLKAFPQLNAEIRGDDIILKRYYHIGIAVSTDEGLVVPVVRDADRKTFAEIEKEIAHLAEKARSRKLTLEDLSGGTFTITNGGVFGSLFSTPILNPPQVGILGMHKVQERPVVVDGQVVVRPMMYVALTYDHRIVDGREAVQFLVKVKEALENPEELLFG